MEDVVIIGAGPSGLFAAGELARHGVRARLLEHDRQPHRQSRATAIQPALLETLARVDLVEEVLAAAVHVRCARFYGPGFRELGAAGFELAGCAYPFQCSLPQWRTEELLTAHLARLGGRVEHGATVTGVERGADAVALAVRWPDGTAETIAARYVVDAGGAHSVTRAAMAEQLEGETYAGHYVVADARLAAPGAADEAKLIVDPGGFVLLAPLPDRHWIIFATAPAGDGEADPPTEGAVAGLLRDRLGRDVGLGDLRWASNFAMHRRIAPRLADGRRFLLGDAAHLSSPIGGEGLNSGLMDAADIAWKLALVLAGRAKPTLLDSYAIERSMADRHVLEVSDLMHRRVMDMVEACRDGRLPAAPPPPDPEGDRRLQRSRAMLDVSYAGSPLVGEHRGAGDEPAAGPMPGMLYPERCALAGTGHHLVLFGAAPPGLDRLAARWAGLVEPVDAGRAGLDATRAGLSKGGALLVRPDGFIGFRAAPIDAAGLAALDRHLAGYLVPIAAAR